MKEPAIITQNTFFMKASSNISEQRRNQKFHLVEVEQYLRYHGFGVLVGVDELFAEKVDWKIKFVYKEDIHSTKIIKVFDIKYKGKKVTIKTFRKYFNTNQN